VVCLITAIPSACRPAAWGLVLLAATGCARAEQTFELGGYQYSTARLVQWALPNRLQEISGLTLDSQDRLFAHADETAVIYQLDYHHGRIIKAFALGSPPVKGDFEGITWAAGQLYLTTSDGDLFVADEGQDGAFVPFQRHVTGFGARCEIEGLSHDAALRLLRFACKNLREPGRKNRTLVLAWSLDTGRPAPEHDLSLRWPPDAGDGAAEPLLGTGSGSQRRLRLTGLTQSTGNGNWLAVASRQNVLVEFDPGGAVLRAFPIPHPEHHPQMEGIAITAAGTLIIADEGGTGRGRLSVYTAGN
jgi:uncharacterized protein YjiK